MRTVAVWGCCGAVAAELVACLSRRADVDAVFVIDDAGLGGRVQEYLERSSVDDHKLRWLSVDYRDPEDGFSPSVTGELFRLVTDVFVAADYDGYPLSAEQIGCLYTLPLGALARLLGKGWEPRLHYLSSLLVAGDRDGAFTEYDVGQPEQLRNAIERARHTAEQEFRLLARGRLATVYRLPLVAPRRRDGAFAAPVSMLGGIARELGRSGSGVLCADEASTLPAAPVDWLADVVALNALSAEPMRGTLHLVGERIALPDFAARVGCAGRRGFRSYLGQKLRGALSNPSEYVRYPYSLTYFDDFRAAQALRRFAIGTSVATACELRTPEADPLSVRQVAYQLRAVADEQLHGVRALGQAAKHVIDDVSVDVWEHGQGMPLVFLPGLLGPEAWFGLARKLGHRYRCLIVGLVGLSRSLPKPGFPTFALPQQASLVRGLMSRLGVAQAHVVASDLAVPVAQFLGGRWPESFLSLSCFNPMQSRDVVSTLPGRQRWLLERPRVRRAAVKSAKSRRRFVERCFASPALLGGRGGATLDRLESLAANYAASDELFERFCDTLRGPPDTADLVDWAAVPVKTLFSLSCECSLTSLSIYVALSELPGGGIRLSLLPRAGLDVAEQQPLSVANRLLRFFDAESPDHPRASGIVVRPLAAPANGEESFAYAQNGGRSTTALVG